GVAPTRVSCNITNSSNADLSDSDGFAWSASNSDSSNLNNANSINTGIYYFRISSGTTQVLKAKAVVNFPSAGGGVTILLQAIRIA
ncbi:hypothetical protein EB118_17470, partial [bacterium]|nr:hypothetical protein [bacterium]